MKSKSLLNPRFAAIQRKKKSIQLHFCSLALLFLTVVPTASVSAKPVSKHKAQQVAEIFFAKETGITPKLKLAELPDSLAEAMYLFVYDNAGYVIVSADDCATPILAYSTKRTFSLHPAVAEWLGMYAREITYLRDNGIEADDNLMRQWDVHLSSMQTRSPESYESDYVLPLLQTEWNQSPYYNNLCPSNLSGQALTGCVATAMAQIMRYWGHPMTGRGSHSYNHSQYGTQSADFENTTYNWSNMPIRLSSASSVAQVNAVATLMYHAGVAVNMNYGVSASSASNVNAHTALINHFKYDPNSRYYYKSNYPDSVWNEMLKIDLRAGRPILYRGDNSSLSGHSFVCDGFAANGLFHFNWGWGGSCDGYYHIGNLNPSGYSFSNNCAAVFGLMPQLQTSGIIDITATSNNNELGSATIGGLTQGSFSIGDTVQLLANANSNGRFVRWSDGSVANPRQYIVSGNHTIFTALFETTEGDTMHYHNCFYSNLAFNSQHNPWGIRIMADEMGGRDSLLAIQLFSTYSSTTSATLSIYAGDRTGDSTMLYEQTIQLSGNNVWLTIALDSAVFIPDDQNLWIMLDALHRPYSTFSGSQNGSIYQQNGIWKYKINASWLISAIFSHSDTRDISVNVVPNNSGYVSGGGRKSATRCHNASLTAYANEGYRFKQWSDGVLSNPRVVNVTSDTSFTAILEQMSGDTVRHDRGTYSHNISNNMVGSVYSPSTLHGNNRLNSLLFYSTSAGQQCRLLVFIGSANNPETMLVDTLVATTVSDGWNCIHLSHAVIIDTSKWLWLAMDGNVSPAPMAIFSGNNLSRMISSNGQSWHTADQYGSLMIRGIVSFDSTQYFTLNASSSNASYGSVRGSGTYASGTSVNIEATPNTCYHFVGWSDGNNSNPRQITVSSDISLIAYFAKTIYHGDEYAEACDSYSWNGTTYTVVPSTTPTLTFSTPDGCDSTATLHLTINHSLHIHDSIVACDSIAWYGTTYKYSNNYATANIPAVVGCDTVRHLHLRIKYSTNSYMFQQACDSIVWFGITYRNDTSVVHTIHATNGCDSNIHLSLMIRNSIHSTDTVSACSRYYWHGVAYTETPDTPIVYNRTIGACTNSDTLILTINHPSESFDTIVACDSAIWGNRTYRFSTTNRTDYLFGGNMYGCDSIAHLHLTINRSSVSNVGYLRVCDSLTYYGNTYYNDTTILQLLSVANHNGCDSSERLNLYVTHTSHTSSYVFACDRYIWRYQTYTETPSAPLVHSNSDYYGCTSSDTLHLVINHSSIFYDTVVTCDSLKWHGNTYSYSTSSPTYQVPEGNMYGCDSTVHLNLTIRHSNASPYTSMNVCDSVTLYGQTYYQEATISHVLSGANRYGCDSTVRIILQVTNTTHQATTATACDSYTWHYQIFTQTPENPVIHNTTDYYGCTSTDTLHLTIFHSSSSVETIEACDSIVWHGTEYTYSATWPTYQVPEGNMNGCDSIVHLNLTIRHSCSSPFTTMNVCDSVSLFGQTYYQDATISNVLSGANRYGCDSTVRIMLHVANTTHHATTATACDNYTWHYQTFTQTPDNPVIHNTTDYYGCTSTDTLHLTIFHSSSSVETIVACDSIVWHGTKYTYSATWPTYQVPEGNMYGCDSTVHLNLTIHRSVSKSVYVTENSNSYQWNDSIYTQSGTYSWVGTTVHGCDSTVTLHLTINPVGISNVETASISVFPSPTTGIITVDSPAEILSIVVYDLNGKKISCIVNNNTIDLSTIAAGLYILDITTTEGRQKIKVIKK